MRLLTSSVGAAPGGPADYVALGTDNPVAQTFLQILNPFAMTRLRTALREFRPDVVQVNMFEKYLSPGIFELLRGVPTVVFVHYYKPVCPTALKVLPDGSLCQVPAGLVCWRAGCVGLPEWLRDRPRYALIRSGLARASKVLACSRWMVEQLRLNGIRSEAIPLPGARAGAELRAHTGAGAALRLRRTAGPGERRRPAPAGLRPGAHQPAGRTTAESQVEERA